MADLNARMPHVLALPHALGTGMLIRTAQPLNEGLRLRITAMVDTYEAALSRFHADSTVSAMGRARHGGTFDFPDWAEPLFTLYDQLAEVTAGALDPCVGEDLIRLGYGADLTFTLETGDIQHPAHAQHPTDAQHPADTQHPDACNTLTSICRLGATHGRPTWRGDVERHGATLITRRAVHLDFGACGKGYLVDLIAAMIITDVTSPDNGVTTGRDTADDNDGMSTGNGTADDNVTTNDNVTSTGTSTTINDSTVPHDGAITDNGMPADNAAYADGAVPASNATTADNGTLTGSVTPAGSTADAGAATIPDIVIDAGGDLLIHTMEPVSIALEDPADPTRAVGIATTCDAAYCASAPSRRHWALNGMLEAHHLINALDGLPVRDIAATWVSVPTHPAARNLAVSQSTDIVEYVSNPNDANRRETTRQTPEPTKRLSDAPIGPTVHAPTGQTFDTPTGQTFDTLIRQFPTALADGLATALFVTDPDTLSRHFGFECALLYADRTAAVSTAFPGSLFTSSAR